jgi:hypothetical protein
MDQEQINFFRHRYAEMDDDELSYLIQTRGSALSPEAALALRAEIASRDPALLKNAMKETAQDVDAKLQHAEEKARKIALRNSRVVSIRRWALALCVAVGYLGALVSEEPDPWRQWASAGVLLFVLFEVKSLLTRFVAALFRQP